MTKHGGLWEESLLCPARRREPHTFPPAHLRIRDDGASRRRWISHVGPDGGLYAGRLGAGGNWGREGKLTHGLWKLTPNGTNAFDLRAMPAVPGGFAPEYTRPLSTETATGPTERYRIKQWRYVPTADHGGPKVDEETLTAQSAALSDDRKTVTLAIPGLKADRVVHVRSPRPFGPADGEPLWSTEARYTLNRLPGATPRTGEVRAVVTSGRPFGCRWPGVARRRRPTSPPRCRRPRGRRARPVR
jgi:hypothetical protein